MTSVSIVTTTYNEREYVRPFVDSVRRVLEGVEHEIIIVDDSSPDGTYEEACKYADKALLVRNAGQTIGLLTGLREARYPIVVTLDIDLENPPELIPYLINKFLEKNLDLLVACRTHIPRISERFASNTIGKIVGIRDFYSNFRVYKRDLFRDFQPRFKESFGGEFIVYAWLNKYRIGEFIYDPPPRRKHPRIGGWMKANTRIFIVTMKLLTHILLNRSIEKL